MLFTTDKQTLDDLNIFGRHGGASVYNIFNRTATRGGAQLLEEMFRYPLSDAEAINRRSGMIRWFAETGAGFPFSSTLFDAIEPYLANTDERTKLSRDEGSLGKKLSQIIGTDVQTTLIYKGVDAITELLKGIRLFLDTVVEGVYLGEKQAMQQLLHGLPEFKEGRLSHVEAAERDILFRFRHRDEIHRLLRHLYLLDVYIAAGKVAIEQKFVFPLALSSDRPAVILDGVYHPHVRNPVGNDVRITPEGNVIFLTGANMAGKSTFMKSLGIALFLAHMGFPVPARRMEFSVLDGIYTTINLPDNLGMGASHFYAEVLRVKKMAQELGQGKRLFIVFDELFRGTNVKDAYEATIALIGAFAEKRTSLFLISTHIIEAGDVLKDMADNISFRYLPTRMQGNIPVYTYTLETGVTADRHGMVIIQNEGILDILENGEKTIL